MTTYLVEPPLDFATAAAHSRGWLLSLTKANGHRIADFPHVAKARGSIAP